MAKYLLCTRSKQQHRKSIEVCKLCKHKETCDEYQTEVIEMFSERLESYLYSTSRDEKRKAIQWCRENSELIDSIWAKDEIERKKASIKRIEEEIKDLKSYLL